MRLSRLLPAFALLLGVLAMPGVPSAAEYGTAAEAAALLDRAIVEAKADFAAAIVKFNDPAGAFRDRDLYVFCASETDGKLIAHPALVGTDLRELKDKNGKPFGSEMFAAAREGTISEVTYMWPRPGGTEPVDKVSRITR
ncbi:MAG: cache domain-containing protein, partial [Bauldia sp.]